MGAFCHFFDAQDNFLKASVVHIQEEASRLKLLHPERVGLEVVGDLMPPLSGQIRLGKDLEGIALSLVLRDQGNPLLQLLKRGKPGKQPGLRKLSGFRMQRHGVGEM